MTTTRLVVKRKMGETFVIPHPDGPIEVTLLKPLRAKLLVVAPSSVNVTWPGRKRKKGGTDDTAGTST